MQIFKKIGQKMKEPLYFKGQIFQNPGQNPVFFAIFTPIFAPTANLQMSIKFQDKN